MKAAAVQDPREERNVLIPLADGDTLAADLRLPGNAGPVPVLLSFDPYRKDDISGAFSEPWRRYLVSRGYGHLLVDVRGTGSSGGESANTFHPQEGIDGAQAVEWAARQRWCDGRVGVWGMSYGGAMALAVASEQPPHLRAAASVYGYTDVYRDSTYPGGCPSALGRYARETWMLALELAPPGYRDRAGRWLEVWRQRLDRLNRDGVHSLTWRGHPDRDSFWQERTIDVESIAVPTLIIGAWRDIFPEAMVNAYERLQCKRKLLMGPWLHTSPDTAKVASVGWLELLADWWDEHLAERPSPGTDAPVTLYVQGEGRWRTEREWPIARTEVRTLQLGRDGMLLPAAADEWVERYRGDARTGTTAGLWNPLGDAVGYPLDQGPDDLLSLTFTSPEIEQAVEITGSPEAQIAVTLVEGDDLDLVIKLEDVWPSGACSLITTGWARCAHLGGDSASRRLERGTRYDVNVRLWATSYLVAAGHRIRVALSCADFPRIWPESSDPVIDVHLGRDGSTIRLPVVPPTEHPQAPVNLPMPSADLDPDPWGRGGSVTWSITQDLIANTVSVSFGGSQSIALPDGSAFQVRHEATARVTAGQPAGAVVLASAGISLETPGKGTCEVATTGVFRRTGQLLEGQVRLDGASYFEGSWKNF